MHSLEPDGLRKFWALAALSSVQVEGRVNRVAEGLLLTVEKAADLLAQGVYGDRGDVVAD